MGIAKHVATKAQQDAAQHAHVLSHVLRSVQFGGDGLKQMELLRQGHEAAWKACGPEVLLLHVMLEVHEALCQDQLHQILNQVIMPAPAMHMAMQCARTTDACKHGRLAQPQTPTHIRC